MNKKDVSKTNAKNPKWVKPFFIFLFVCFVVYAMLQIVSQQAEIAELKNKANTADQKIVEARQINDEYKSLLGSDEDEYMRRMAIDKSGYAYPNERRFYMVDGKD